MVVSLMEMLGGLGKGIGSPSFNTSYDSRPPTLFPKPFSASNQLGSGQNPFLGALKNPGVSEMLMDLGYGMLNSTNFGDALAVAGNRTLEMEPDRREAREEQERRARYAELIGGWGDEYADFAQGIADGAFDPADGFWKALQFKQSQAEEGADLARDRANAQLLTDPQLRSMVEAGALSFKDAYDYQVEGAKAPEGPAAPSGYQWALGPEGETQLAPITGGPADPNKPDNKPPTEAELRSAGLTTVVAPDAALLLGDGTAANPGIYDQLANTGDQNWNVGGFGINPLSFMSSPEYRQAKDAVASIAQSYLYSTSGASAPEGEAQRIADSVTPKPFDSPEQLADKKRRLESMVLSIQQKQGRAAADGGMGDGWEVIGVQ